MKTSQIAMVFACIAAAIATPIAAPEPAAFVEHFRENAQFSNGSLVWYGPEEDLTPHKTVVPRKATGCTKPVGTPSCDTSHAARNAECDQLVNELNANGDTTVPQSPRQVCYKGDASKDDSCCVSWSQVIPNLVKADLAGPAYTLEKQCTSSGISGLIRNVQLEGVCTTVCLSNRGKGCTDGGIFG